MFCPECQLRENKAFRVSSLCLYPRHWNGVWRVVGFQPAAAKGMEGVCALRAGMLCDQGQGACVHLLDVTGSGPSAGLWQCGGHRQGFWRDPQAAWAPRPPPRDRRMAEGEVVSEDRGSALEPIPASPTCD